jgi:hypothetical protein
MGSQKCRIVGKSQSVLIVINPIIFTRTRTEAPCSDAGSGCRVCSTGRFEREICVRCPDAAGRREMLDVMTRDMVLDSDVDLSAVGDAAQGYVGADLASLCRHAGLAAICEAIRLDEKKAGAPGTTGGGGGTDADTGAVEWDDSKVARLQKQALGAAVSRAFPSWDRSILTEIYLCHACSYHEVEDGNARTGVLAQRGGAPLRAGLHAHLAALLAHPPRLPGRAALPLGRHR